MAAAYETAPGSHALALGFGSCFCGSQLALICPPAKSSVMSKVSADSDESNSVSEKRPARPKRQASRATTADPSDSSTDEEPEAKSDDEGSSNTWDCSLCTFK